MNALTTVVSEQKLDFNERCDGSPQWLSDALASIDTNTLWRYPDRSVLEKQLADRYQLVADSVLVTNGGDEGIDLILRIEAKTRATLLLPLPAFSMYRITAARNDVVVKTVAPLSEGRLDIASLANNIAANQLIALTSPNNPTGEIISFEQAKLIVEKAQAVNSMVLFDAAYAEFNNADYSIELAKTYDNVISLRSFSKVYGMAALRVGYLVGNAAIINRVRALAPPYNVSAISLRLAQSALSDEAQRDQQRYVAMIQNNVELVRTRLLAMGVAVQPSGGNFILLQLKEKQAALLSSVLNAQQIRVRCFTEDELKGCVRITIPRDCSRLLRVFEQVLKPQLLCLDMDGVLIDTSDSYDACVAACVAALGGQATTHDAIQQKRNTGGFNDDWKLTQALLADQNIIQPLPAVIKTFQGFYEGQNGFNQREKVMVSTATASVLKQFRTAVVTGRPANEAVDGTHRMPWTVDALVSRDDVKNLKPDPEGIRSMQQQFKTEFSWMFGDSVDDMRAARASGSVAIGVGLANQTALIAAGAHFVVDSINELGELL